MSPSLVAGGSDGTQSACDVGDLGSIPGLGRCPGGGNGYPLQYSDLENAMDRGAWQAAVQGVTKSWTRLSDLHTHTRVCVAPSLSYCLKLGQCEKPSLISVLRAG